MSCKWDHSHLIVECQYDWHLQIHIAINHDPFVSFFLFCLDHMIWLFLFLLYFLSRRFSATFFFSVLSDHFWDHPKDFASKTLANLVDQIIWRKPNKEKLKASSKRVEDHSKHSNFKLFLLCLVSIWKEREIYLL